MAYTLPHVGGEPISHRVCLDLLEALKHGEFSTCDQLPSENDLAARYEVSRSVIRDALSTLEREGFLQRMRGIGTLIHRDIVNLNTRLDLKMEYNELIRSMGYIPAVDSVSLSVGRADEKLAGQLQLDVGEEVIICEKRLLAGNRPVIYSVDHLPFAMFSGIRYMALDWGRPVFDLLEECLRFDVDTDIASISATMGPPAVRRKLAVREDEALLFIDEVGYYRLTHPVLQSYGYYTDFFNFTMLRKRF